MAEPRRAMGRGLAAILPDAAGDDPRDQLRELAVELIRPNPRQPRSQFDAEQLQSLADSVVENGILQPLLVRALPGGSYELVAGERRLRAAKQAGLTTVPAVVRASLDSDTLELALIENMARTDLNPIDEARACSALVEDLGLTKEEVARRVGRSRVAVSNLIRLLNLPDDVIALVEQGDLSEGHGRAILRATDQLARKRLARNAVDKNWSVRETERQAENAQANQPIAAVTQLHPDLEDARNRAIDLLSRALGHDVKLNLGRGASGQIVTVSIKLNDLDEVLELARKLEERGR